MGRTTSTKKTKSATGAKFKLLSIDQLPKLYTVKDVAEYFGVCIWTVYGWQQEGIIVPTKQGRRCVRYTAQQIEDCKKRRENLAAKN